MLTPDQIDMPNETYVLIEVTRLDFGLRHQRGREQGQLSTRNCLLFVFVCCLRRAQL